ncbi:hypothetical protein ACWDUL_08965 [Nocardia niigatensis]
MNTISIWLRRCGQVAASGALLIALTVVVTLAASTATPGAAHAEPAAAVSTDLSSVADNPTPTAINDLRIDAKNNDWAKRTAEFAGCLGGFGFVAAPIIVAYAAGGGGAAWAVMKSLAGRLGPVGGAILNWCYDSVLR